MRFHLRASALLLVTFGFSATASGQEPIRFARTPDISPDGKMVAFSYLGDIWTVETIGGVARPVTMHEAHDINPVFSPDGRSIAFSSNRHGSYDVFVVPSVGGKPKRLTFDCATDMVTGWTPDGKNVVFASSRSTAFPPNIEQLHRCRGRRQPSASCPSSRGRKPTSPRPATRSPSSADRERGIAAAIADRATTTSGSRTSTARSRSV